MSNTNLKCIYCGNEQTGDISITESVCNSCNKTFSTSRGAKYYTSMHKLEGEEKKVAYGEMYQKADTLITEGEFYLKNEDFENAEEKFKNALEITTVDKRIYLGLVKTYTKNFTDFKDTKHYEYLNKVISLSTKEEKEEIRTLYKAYYQMCNYTPEEMAMYNEEELKARKTRTEELLKDGIPRHYKTTANIKTYKLLFPISFAIALITFIVGLFIKDQTISFVLDVCSIVFTVIALIFIVCLSGALSKTAVYDFALDFYDEFDNLELPVKEGVDCFEALETVTVDYLNGATPITLENDLSELIFILANSENTLAFNFIKKYKISTKLIKELEE